MAVSIILCVFLFHGLMVNGFPASDIMDDGVDLGLIGVPVEEEEFNGTVPSEDSLTIFDETFPEMLPALNPSTFTDSESNDELFAPINKELEDNDNKKMIPLKVILGAILADAIMAEKGAEIDAKLAELDSCVEAEIITLSPLIQSKLEDTDTSEIDRYVDSVLHEIESQIDSELAMIDEIVESELERTENVVESVINNVDSLSVTAECPNATEIPDVKDSDLEKSVELEVAKVESFLESQLIKTESIINSELEKINALVESELAQVDDIVESELYKVDSFIKKEIAKTDAVVKSELSKVESFVDTELEKVEIPVEGVLEFHGIIPAYGTAMIIGNCEYPPMPNIEGNINDDVSKEEPITSVQVEGTFPVIGRTLILGHTECPPISPTAEPLPIYTQSFPVMDTLDYEDSYDPMLLLPNLPQNPPTVRVANPLISTTHAPIPYYTTNTGTFAPQITILPRVNLIRNPSSDGLDGATINGDLEFSGTVKATGRASVFAEFPCAPLTATEEGPDGKKYIWISKNHSNNDQSPIQPKPEFPTYPVDFPATIIMDSSKNYEKLMSEDLDVDFGGLGPVLVNGEATFEGTAPAFGAVSIRGHCA